LVAATFRISSLIAQFSHQYGGQPSYVSRAPGRVNLIGKLSPFILLKLNLNFKS